MKSWDPGKLTFAEPSATAGIGQEETFPTPGNRPSEGSTPLGRPTGAFTHKPTFVDQSATGEPGQLRSFASSETTGGFMRKAHPVAKLTALT